MWQRYDPVSFNTIRRQTIKPVDHAQEAIHHDDHKRHSSIKRKADVILATSTPIKEAKKQITKLIESDAVLGIMPSTLQEAAVECLMYSIGTIPTITDCIRHAATTDDIESARMERALAQYIPTASPYIRSEVRKLAGCNKEQASMDVFERVSGKTVHGRNDQLYVSVLSPGGNAPVKIGGRVDGIQEGCVIEHKQRRYRLFGYLSQPERIQLYVYMYLTGLQTGQLVETFGDKQQAHLVTFDQDVWNEYSARISDAVQELFNMIFEEDSGRRHALFSVRNCKK
jgi:hypothetical protein